MQGFDRYKVLTAAYETPTFTVRDLATRASVSETNVHQIINRSRELFKEIGIRRQGRGRPATRYCIDPEQVAELQQELLASRRKLQQMVGIEVTEPEPVVESPALHPLRVAEIELGSRFAEARDDLERGSVLDRARDMLFAVRKLEHRTPEVERRMQAVEARLRQLSARLSHGKRIATGQLTSELTR